MREECTEGMGRKEKESEWSAGHRKGRYARSTMINGVRSKTGDVGVIDIGLLPLPNGRESAGLKITKGKWERNLWEVKVKSLI